MQNLAMSQRFEDELARLSWPGNIRELRQVLARSAILEDGPVLRGTYFQPDSGKQPAASGNAASRRVTIEDIHRAIEQAGGNKSVAAAALRISRKTLYAKLDAAFATEMDVTA